jgi:hypothetical protein
MDHRRHQFVDRLGFADASYDRDARHGVPVIARSNGFQYHEIYSRTTSRRRRFTEPNASSLGRGVITPNIARRSQRGVVERN